MHKCYATFGKPHLPRLRPSWLEVVTDGDFPITGHSQILFRLFAGIEILEVDERQIVIGMIGMAAWRHGGTDCDWHDWHGGMAAWWNWIEQLGTGHDGPTSSSDR